MIYLISFIAAVVAAQTALMAAFLWLLIKRLRHTEGPSGEPTEGGMDLLLLKKKTMKRKAKRFTDKSRAWITAHEEATRR